MPGPAPPTSGSCRRRAAPAFLRDTQVRRRFGGAGALFPPPVVSWVCVALIALISLSRLYLGAHFPATCWAASSWALSSWPSSLYCRRCRSAAAFHADENAALHPHPAAAVSAVSRRRQEQLVGFSSVFHGRLAHRIRGALLPAVSLKRQVVKVLAGYAGLVALGILHALFVPVGLPGVFGYALIGVWIAIGAPALFRRLGVAGDVQKPEWTAEIRHNVRHYAWTALAVLVLVAGTSVYVHVAVPKVTPPPMFAADGVLIIGHRGAAGLAPENTLVSFETALAHGAHVLELDVHRTRDGEAVVIHDKTVDRTTNGSDGWPTRLWPSSSSWTRATGSRPTVRPTRGAAGA